MEQKSDLRVTKTRRPIKAAFLELVQTKPGQKITVTELAKRAEISKGTFYLHYLDIYNLYNQMVPTRTCFPRRSPLCGLSCSPRSSRWGCPFPPGSGPC